MQQISLVKSIFETLESEFPGKLQRVRGIHISVGLLSSIQPLLMESAFGAVLEDEPRYRNTSLHVEVLPVMIYCKDCDKTTEVVDCKFVCTCGKACRNIVQVDELLISKVEFAEGDDKPRKYPSMFLTSELMLVSKSDLLPYLPFSVEAVTQDARDINARLDAITISSLKRKGLDKCINWLIRKVKEKKSKLLVNNEVEN